jgi:hypothetical protein
MRRDAAAENGPVGQELVRSIRASVSETGTWHGLLGGTGSAESRRVQATSMSATVGASPTPAGQEPARHHPARSSHPCLAASALDTLVGLVLLIVESTTDVPTLGAWAALAGKSVSSLRLHCYAVHLSPRKTLLFARLLRAVCLANGGRWDLGDWMLAADPRTLVKAARLGGIPEAAARAPHVADYLASQTLLPTGCRTLDTLSLSLRPDSGATSPSALGIR